MKIKKIAGILLAMMMLGGVCACGDNGGTKSEQSETSSGSTDSGSSEDGSSEGGGISTNAAITLTKNFQGERVSLLGSDIVTYLDANTSQEALAALEAHAGSNAGAESVRIEWNGNGSVAYTVEIADNEGFVGAREIVVSGYTPYLDLTNLVPFTVYYWRVRGSKEQDTSAVGTFSTDTHGVRYISADGGANMRDLGGYENEDGLTVRYGLLYRGNCLNGYNGGAKLSDEGKATFTDELGMRTEIDLRTAGSDDGGQTENAFDAKNPYVKAPLGQYTQIFDPAAVASLRAIFAQLADEAAYPVYLHCNAGADRTGTLAFLVNGLLGVPYEDLVRDFELTSFSSISGKRYRSAVNAEGTDFDESGVYQTVEAHGNFVAFDLMYREMLAKYGKEGGTLSEAIENYLLNYIGVSEKTLFAVKSILLDGYRAPTADDIVVSGEPQRILLTDDVYSITLPNAEYESVQSISIGNTSLGTDLSNLDLTHANGLFGNVTVRVVVVTENGTQAYQVPVLLVTKEISTWQDLQKTIKASDKAALYGYYVLTEDLSYNNGSSSINDHMEDWWVEDGLVGFRGTLDGQGHTISYASAPNGLFSMIGMGAVIKNIKINDYNYGGMNQTLFAESCIGATFENVEITMLDGGSSDVGDFRGWLVSGFCHNTTFKNVTLNAAGKQVGSLLGGYSNRGYDWGKACTFENVRLNLGGLQELAHLRTDSTGGVLQSVNFYELDGIGGKVGDVSQEENVVRLTDKTSWISVDSKFGVGATVTEIYYGDQAVPFSAINDMYIFSTGRVFALTDVGEQTLRLKVTARDFEIELAMSVLVDSGYEKIALTTRQDVLLTEKVNGLKLTGYEDYEIVSVRCGTMDLGTSIQALQLGEIKADTTKHGEQTVTVWAAKGEQGVEISVPVTFITEKINDFKRLKEVCSITDWNETKGKGTYYILGKDFSASTDEGADNGIYTIGGTITLSGGGLGCGFQGTLDGRGCSISDVNFNSLGLFGALTNATVKDISFTNATIVADCSVLAANVDNSVIENVHVTLKSSVTQTSGGFLIAQQSQKTTFKDVTVTAAGSSLHTLVGAGEYAGGNTNVFTNVRVQAKSMTYVGGTAKSKDGVRFETAQ